ncbi:AAA family ATPase [Motiliproteus coralliicola]|nr:bifunctional aminoglycoside phosphotransferase/ATP-binding protein [Motiliproteus coralliicola]
MTSAELINNLQHPQRFDHPVTTFELIETHISWVLLTGPFAYKFRKPVDFGFLDFTTLEKRFDDCLHELRLNRRFSPALYHGLVKIIGTPQAPQRVNVDETEPLDPQALDYGVQMRQFEQPQLLSELELKQQLPEAELLHLATELAGIHARAPADPPDPSLGSVETVRYVMQQNFDQCRPYLELLESDEPDLLQLLNRVEQQYLQRFAAQQDLLQRRQDQGLIRECHGDLHLGNIALVDGRACPFDCIEFNPRYRWLDPLNDLAFLLMDLQLRGHRQLSYRLLNRYLEQSPDYTGAGLLPLYMAYRSMVRAKVSLLGSGEPGLPLPPALRDDLLLHLQLAEQLLQPTPSAKRGRLVLMQGPSGSGKSWLSQQLLEQQPWLRLRSDRLRKQLHQRQPELPRYGDSLNQATYRQLLKDGSSLMAQGFDVIIDAAFLRADQRRPFIELAGQHDWSVNILCCDTNASRLAERIEIRQSSQDPSEATVAVMEQQLQNREPLSEEEAAVSIQIDTDRPEQVEACLRLLSRN